MNVQLKDAAREVVQRARAGDQVAVAHITRIRDGATAGNPVLKETANAIKGYIKANPVRKTDSRWGSEVSVNTNPQAQEAVWKARTSSP